MMLKKTLVAGLVLIGGVTTLRAVDLTLDAIFPADRVLDVQITVAPGDWDTIRYQSRNFFEALNARRQFEPIPGPYTYVEASVSIDGVEFPKVGLRKKGFIGSQSSIRPSLKVKLDFVDPEGKIEGLNNLTFNNNKQDAALVSQFMGYGLFNKAGSPAPRCSFANITVNGKNLGIYSHVETYRKPLLKRGFGDDEGTLYEGTVVDFYEDWEKSFELKRGDDEAGRAKIKELIGLLNAGGGATGVAILDSETGGTGWVPTSNELDEDWMNPGFDDSGWKKGRGGAGFEITGGYEDHFSPGLDFEKEMHEQTGSVYLRYSFDVQDHLSKIKGLTLRMKYDDGFIAYLNGQRVADANAPRIAGWTSQATGPHDDGAAIRYENFPISEHIGKLQKGVNILAIHGLNTSPESSDLLISPELRASTEAEKERDIEKEIGSLVDLDAFYKFWAMEGLLGFWDGYSGNRNNFYFYLNPATGKFHFTPWGADSLFVKYSHINPDRRVPLSVKTGGMIANKLYQRPQSRARYKKTLLAILESHWDEKKLLAETDRIEKLLEPYVEKYSRQRRFGRSLEGVREFIRTRREELLEEISDGMPLWKKAHEPPVAIPGGGIFGRGRGRDDDKEKDSNAVDDKPGDLWDAARKGDVEAVKWHLEKMGGKDAIDRKDGLGAAALSWAAGLGRLEVVEYLVKNGANVNITNKEGKSPLDDALGPLDDQAAEFIAGIFRVKIDPDEVNKAKPKIAALLRKNGGKTGAQLGGLKGGDIWAAARSGDVEALRAHLKPGADIDKKDQFGTTALHWAVALGRVEAVKLLLQKGADVNEGNNEGKTPLDETFEPWTRLAVDFMKNFFRVETDPAEVDAGRKAIQPLLKAKGARRGSKSGK